MAIVERLQAKLDQPCGSCHACANYGGSKGRNERLAAALSAAEARVEALQRQVATARTEWGVRLTWPSGETDDQKRDSQGDARQMADWHNTSGCSVCTAELITRTVAVSDWSLTAAVPGKPQPTEEER